MKEAYYFSHDSNARNDEKIISLLMKHKWAGYGLFWAIIEKMRDSSNYQLLKDYNVLAFDLRVDTALIKSIVEEFGLFVFTDDGKYFYSKRLQNTMYFKELKSQKAKESAEKRWGKSESKADAMRTHSDGNAKKGKEKKEKKIRGAGNLPTPKNDFVIREQQFYNSLAQYVETYGKEIVRKFYDYWREPNKSKSKMRWEQERTWDLSLRLKKWETNDFKFNAGKQNYQPVAEPSKMVM